MFKLHIWKKLFKKLPLVIQRKNVYGLNLFTTHNNWNYHKDGKNVYLFITFQKLGSKKQLKLKANGHVNTLH